MENQASLQSFLKGNLLVLILLGVGGLLFLFGAIDFLSQNRKEEVTFSEERPQEADKVFVDIEGAVAKPGIYKLSQDARVQDVLIQAGGLTSNADRGWMEKNLNLATKVSDGAKIYIPRTGESAAGVVTNTSTSSSVSSLISINSASSSELDTLPGIGPVTAEKIISNRPYAALDDLVSKKAVSSSVFEKIKDKISL